MKMDNYFDYNIATNKLFITKLHIPSLERRKGKGTLIINQLVEIAKNNECDAILVAANASKIALSFYLKNGFKPLINKEWKHINDILSGDNPLKIHSIGTNTTITLKKEI